MKSPFKIRPFFLLRDEKDDLEPQHILLIIFLSNFLLLISDNVYIKLGPKHLKCGMGGQKMKQHDFGRN